jgi:hypothetical protein
MVSDPWLGWFVEVSVDVDVLFKDGAVCKVTNSPRGWGSSIGGATSSIRQGVTLLLAVKYTCKLLLLQ